MSGGPYMTWITCQPKARLDRLEQGPGLRLGGEDRLLERLVDLAVLVEVGQLAAGAAGASGLSLVALGAGDGVEQVRSGFELLRRRPWLRPRPAPGRVVSGDGRGIRGIVLRGVQDVADLDRLAAEVVAVVRDVDLGDVALRSRARGVGDDLVLELLADDVAGDCLAVLREVDACRLDLGRVVGVDRGRPRSRSRRPTRKTPSAPSHDSGRRVGRRREHRLEECLVRWRSSVRTQPRSPPCGAVAASVETVFATSSQVFPPAMSLSAASILAFAAAFWASVGAMAPGSVCGFEAMTQPWRASGVVASVVIRASMSSGPAVMPWSAASFAWSLSSMSLSRVVFPSCDRCWLRICVCVCA